MVVECSTLNFFDKKSSILWNHPHHDSSDRCRGGGNKTLQEPRCRVLLFHALLTVNYIKWCQHCHLLFPLHHPRSQLILFCVKCQMFCRRRCVYKYRCGLLVTSVYWTLCVCFVTVSVSGKCGRVIFTGFFLLILRGIYLKLRKGHQNVCPNGIKWKD